MSNHPYFLEQQEPRLSEKEAKKIVDAARIKIQNEKAAANVARMEARISGDSQTKAASQSSNFMKEYRQSQQAQLRIFLVIMVIAGAGFLLYGFLKKEETSDES